MSSPQQPAHSTDTGARRIGFEFGGGGGGRRRSTETKASWKTTELVFYLLTVIAIMIASAVVDENDADNVTGFDAHQAWTLITFLTIGYMLSRGLAKSGAREFYTDDRHDDE
jgi:hypothetical protein